MSMILRWENFLLQLDYGNLMHISDRSLLVRGKMSSLCLIYVILLLISSVEPTFLFPHKHLLNQSHCLLSFSLFHTSPCSEINLPKPLFVPVIPSSTFNYSHSLIQLCSYISLLLECVFSSVVQLKYHLFFEAFHNA